MGNSAGTGYHPELSYAVWYGKARLGHSVFQLRPLRSEAGQYRALN